MRTRVFIGVVGVVVGALAVFVFRWPAASDGLFVGPSGEGVVPAMASPFLDEHVVELRLEWTEPVPIPAPAWSGIVTDSSCTPGAMLTSGSPVLSIDTVPRFALATSVPLYRHLSLRAKGADVVSLQQELVRLGRLDTASGVLDAATVTAFAAMTGRAGSPSLGIDPSEVVWLPAPTVEVGTCNAAVGQPAPSSGVLATTAARLGSVSVLAAGDERPGARVLSYNGVESPIPDDGVLRDGAVFDALSIVPKDVTQEDPQGSSRLAVALPTVQVPASAIVADSDGAACVLTPAADPIVVEIIGSRLGVVFVLGDLTDGEDVLVAPPGDSRCSS